MVPWVDAEGFFPCLQLQLAGPTQLENQGIEPLGSKRKFWLTLKEEPHLWLFKFARHNTGENWAEKIGAELAHHIGLPAARVELAEIDGQQGALVESVVPEVYDTELDQRRRLGELIHGNEILAGHVAGYEKSKQWGQSEHSWQNIREALSQVLSSEEFPLVMQQFSGLVVLDALIGNTDRHHENWALLVDRSATASRDQLGLCPSYDHASSLGRELTDERREQMTKTDRVGEYVRRGQGAIFSNPTGRHGDNPLALVRWASQQHPAWFRPWLERIHQVHEAHIADLLRKVPPRVFSPAANAFCQRFIEHTLKELKGIQL